MQATHFGYFPCTPQSPLLPHVSVTQPGPQSQTQGSYRDKLLQVGQYVDSSPDGSVGPRLRSVWGQVLVRQYGVAAPSTDRVCMMWNVNVSAAVIEALVDGPP